MLFITSQTRYIALHLKYKQFIIKRSLNNSLAGIIIRFYFLTGRLNEDVLQREMLAYDREPPPPSDSNPLSWWREKRVKYPHLAQLARCYLAICGTSVRAERVFSTAGNIVTKKRSSLDPENVNQLIFLANNLKKAEAK